jgi:hypothetical protein
MRDLDIRNALKATKLKKYYQDAGSIVVDELSLCRGDARVDIAVVNGSLHGFEIKSEQDTLVRLANQIDVYSKVFDYLTLCVGPRHLEKVTEIIPEWCGILVATEKASHLTVNIVRAAFRNEATDTLSTAQLLWRPEVVAALADLGITKGVSGKPKPYLWNLLAESATQKQVSSYVRSALKARVNWRSDLQPFESDGLLPLFAK